jgi:hypothetical protein
LVRFKPKKFIGGGANKPSRAKPIGFGVWPFMSSDSLETLFQQYFSSRKMKFSCSNFHMRKQNKNHMIFSAYQQIKIFKSTLSVG